MLSLVSVWRQKCSCCEYKGRYIFGNCQKMDTPHEEVGAGFKKACWRSFSSNFFEKLPELDLALDRETFWFRPLSSGTRCERMPLLKRSGQFLVTICCLLLSRLFLLYGLSSQESGVQTMEGPRCCFCASFEHLKLGIATVANIYAERTTFSNFRQSMVHRVCNKEDRIYRVVRCRHNISLSRDNLMLDIATVGMVHFGREQSAKLGSELVLAVGFTFVDVRELNQRCRASKRRLRRRNITLHLLPPLRRPPSATTLNKRWTSLMTSSPQLVVSWFMLQVRFVSEDIGTRFVRYVWAHICHFVGLTLDGFLKYVSFDLAYFLLCPFLYPDLSNLDIMFLLVVSTFGFLCTVIRRRQRSPQRLFAKRRYSRFRFDTGARLMWWIFFSTLTTCDAVGCWTKCGGCCGETKFCNTQRYSSWCTQCIHVHEPDRSTDAEFRVIDLDVEDAADLEDSIGMEEKKVVCPLCQTRRYEQETLCVCKGNRDLVQLIQDMTRAVHHSDVDAICDEIKYSCTKLEERDISLHVPEEAGANDLVRIKVWMNISFMIFFYLYRQRQSRTARSLRGQNDDIEFTWDFRFSTLDIRFSQFS